MKIILLKEFVTLAEQGTYTGAAKVLNMSRSNLGKRIRSLEREIGLTLVRHGSRPVLTPVGERFLEEVKPLVEEIDEVLTKSRRIQQYHDDNVIIAEPPFLLGKAAEVYYAELKPLRYDFAETPVRFGRFPYLDPEDLVASGRVGIALMYDWGNVDEIVRRCESRNIFARYLVEEPFMVFCSQDHPFVQRGCVAIGQLAETKIIASSGKFSPFQRAIMTMCQHHGFEPKFSIMRKDVMLFHKAKEGVYLFPEQMARDPRFRTDDGIVGLPLVGDDVYVRSFMLANERSRALLNG